MKDDFLQADPPQKKVSSLLTCTRFFRTFPTQPRVFSYYGWDSLFNFVHLGFKELFLKVSVFKHGYFELMPDLLLRFFSRKTGKNGFRTKNPVG